VPAPRQRQKNQRRDDEKASEDDESLLHRVALALRMNATPITVLMTSSPTWIERVLPILANGASASRGMVSIKMPRQHIQSPASPTASLAAVMIMG